jgi:hypothetical protein
VSTEESTNSDPASENPSASQATHPAPEELWHYTDAAGLLGILGGGSAATAPSVATFWATGLEYLNDHQELLYGLQHVRLAIVDFTEQFRITTYGPDEPHIYVNIGDKVTFLERLCNAITAVIDRTYPHPIHCYITSFSTQADLLSQWRGYGAGLDGYAIAINPAGLTETRGHPLRPSGHLAPVYYGDAEVPDELAFDVLNRLQNLLLPTDAPSSSEGMIAQQLRWIATLAAQVKHDGFREEAEWRYIEPGYDGASYRTRGTRLTPYASWQLPLNRIIGVKVGPSPTQHENVRAIGGFLHRNGFHSAAENVTFSKTPFR